jgi:hypothetical protein
MSLGAVLFLVALFVTVFVAVPVTLATVIQREGPAASWLRSHSRWFLFGAALSWLASLVLKLLHGSSLSQFDVVAAAVGFAATLAAALLHHRDGERIGLL